MTAVLILFHSKEVILLLSMRAGLNSAAVELNEGWFYRGAGTAAVFDAAVE